MTEQQKLQDLITLSGLSIAKVSRLADIPALSLYNYLKGKSDMMHETYAKIENILKEKTK